MSSSFKHMPQPWKISQRSRSQRVDVHAGAVPRYATRFALCHKPYKDVDRCEQKHYARRVFAPYAS